MRKQFTLGVVPGGKLDAVVIIVNIICEACLQQSLHVISLLPLQQDRPVHVLYRILELLDDSFQKPCM